MAYPTIASYILWLTLPPLLCADPLYDGIDLACLHLEEAQYLALRHNQGYLLAQERSNLAEAEANHALSAFLPHISYHTEWRALTKQEFFPDVYRGDEIPSHYGYKSSLQLTQTLFSLPSLYRLQSERRKAEGQSLEQKRSAETLKWKVQTMYLQVLLESMEVAIAKEHVDYIRQALEQEASKVSLGSSPFLDAEYVQVSKNQAVSAYYRAQAIFQTTLHELIFTLGIPPSLAPAVKLASSKSIFEALPSLKAKLQQAMQKIKDSSFDCPLFSSRELADYRNQALSHRGDLQALLHEIQAAGATLKEEQAQYWPKVQAYVRYGYNDDDVGALFQRPTSHHLSGGIALSWTLFSGLSTYYKVQASKANVRAHELTAEATAHNIETEIYRLIAHIQHDLFAYLSALEQVQVLQQKAKQTLEQMQLGKITPLTYRRSTDAVCEAKKQELAFQRALFTHYYQLLDTTNAVPSSK
jgi:outer membrane protein TolC